MELLIQEEFFLKTLKIIRKKQEKESSVWTEVKPS